MTWRFMAHGAMPPRHLADRFALAEKTARAFTRTREVETEALATHACGAANSKESTGAKNRADSPENETFWLHPG
jgi:hypothetical protein